MKKVRQPYTFFQFFSAMLMIMALLWLTVSIPFVYEHQQKIATQANMPSADIPETNAGEETNPLGNTTEEKAPNSVNTFSEEYLHDTHHAGYLLSIASCIHKWEKAGIYIAFHGELLVPPPNFS